MKVRRKKYPSGRVKWQLDLGMIDGRRFQTYFDTKERALGALAEAKAKRRANGESALTLSEDERIRFCAARDKLAGVGATIEEAVTAFMRSVPARREPLALSDLLARCVAEKRNLGNSKRYLQQFRCSCLSFIRGREHIHAHEVTREEVRGWILGNGWSPKTQRVYLGDLRTLFAYALEVGICSGNPAAGEKGDRIQLAPTSDCAIATLTAAEAEKLLVCAARKPSDPSEEDFRPLLTYAALGLFCGIRPAELGRMQRSQISLEERHAIVEGHQAKTRRRRVVDISENALDWLALDPTGPVGPVTPLNFRRRWGRLRAAAGWRPELQALNAGNSRPDLKLREWSHDAMRHTFASMHYAAHQNESLLKAQLGHSSKEEVLFQHYRALKTRAEATTFWTLTPLLRVLKLGARQGRCCHCVWPSLNSVLA